MKKTFYWLTLISAFMLGFITNEYRHQQFAMQTKPLVPPVSDPIATNRPDNNSPSAKRPADNLSTPVNPAFSWELLQQLTHRQDYEAAIGLLKDYLKTFPDDAQAWYWLANCYQSQGKLALAVETWFEYLMREQDTNRAQTAIENLKRLLQQSGQHRPVDNSNAPWLMDQINKLLEISINDHQLHLMLAQLHLDTGDHYQAQYHALMAANHPDTEPQAEKILAQLNGDISDEPIELSLTRYGDQFIVTVYIENTPANLLLDTGASISGVTSRYVAKYPFMVKNSKPIQLNTASGTKESYLFTVDNLQMGNTRFAQHMLAVLPMNELTEFDGLLGVDILGKFDFVIDQNNSALKLNPRKP